jgi:hypothetical protein
MFQLINPFGPPPPLHRFYLDLRADACRRHECTLFISRQSSSLLFGARFNRIIEFIRNGTDDNDDRLSKFPAEIEREQTNIGYCANKL